MKQFKFFHRFTGEEKATLTINGDGTFSVEPKEFERTFRDMLGHMGDNPKPTSIYEFIKSGLYGRVVFRFENGELFALQKDD